MDSRDIGKSGAFSSSWSPVEQVTVDGHLLKVSHSRNDPISLFCRSLIWSRHGIRSPKRTGSVACTSRIMTHWTCSGYFSQSLGKAFIWCFEVVSPMRINFLSGKVSSSLSILLYLLLVTSPNLVVLARRKSKLPGGKLKIAGSALVKTKKAAATHKALVPFM